jgi:hypothetical protein
MYVAISHTYLGLLLGDALLLLSLPGCRLAKLTHVNKQLGTQRDRFLTKTIATTAKLALPSRLWAYFATTALPLALVACGFEALWRDT